MGTSTTAPSSGRSWPASASAGVGPAAPERGPTRPTAVLGEVSRCRLDGEAYRRRNVVERCFNKLKLKHKAMATRYDKLAHHCQAMVALACLRPGCPDIADMT
ncbi:hypothetical protein CA983_15790 [Streptomyces swartbergensis]|uniref:Uncharacterized protein n=1 Tax=Streptomyces swartbergensis TaxID=487165 RepID=A0A243S3V6_9ACTN|nr:hypothetical protein CA983_15790 [Streptomyces swartbergensis]